MPALRHFIVLLALVLAPTGLSAGVDENARFATANTAYENGDFESAAKDYRALIESGTRAPDLYFNLGNAEYRLKQSGEAALAYGRALVLDPTHAESRQNLRFLKRKTGLLEFEESGFVRFGQKFGENHVVVGLCAAAWTLVLSIATLLLLRPRRAFLGLAVTLATLGFLATGIYGSLAVAHRMAPSTDSLAIVTVDDAKAFTAPAKSADDVIVLPPGSEVRILNRRESWIYVAIPGDLRGWVESSAIEALDA